VSLDGQLAGPDELFDRLERERRRSAPQEYRAGKVAVVEGVHPDLDRCPARRAGKRVEATALLAVRFELVR
jgi:hypothetical protein